MPDAVLWAGWVACVLACAAGVRRLARRDASSPGGAWRTVAGNALVLALLLLALLGVAEAWLRFGADLSDGLAATRSGRRWFEHHWHTNGVGVRDDVEYGPGGRLALAPPAGVRRLTLIGDSVTAGQGVPDVSDRFANRVRTRLGPGFELHVFAEGGFETGDELATLRDLFARGYRTDRVLLVYFPNDITDLLPDWQASLARIREPSRLHAILRGSYALDFAWWRLRLARDPDARRYREIVRAAYEGEAWAAQQRRLLALRDAVRSGGAQLAVVTLPFFEAASDSGQGEALARIDRFWREAGVPHLDLGPRFAGRDPASLVASRWDEHPNATTHGEIAEEILRFLAGLER